MAEEKPDKESQTEEPTEHKIRKALEKGNVPVSRELSLFAGLCALSLIAVFIAYPAFSQLGTLLGLFFERPEDWSLNNAKDLTELFNLITLNVAKALFPLLIILTVFGIGSYVVQNSPNFILDRIRPKLSRLSLQNGMQRIFSRAGFVEFLKSLFKLSLTSLLIYIIFFHHNDLFHEAFALEAQLLPEFIRHELVKLFLANALAMGVLAIFDLSWSRLKWRRDLRMTRYEIKQEYKDTEGDPLVKSRMQSLARDRLRRQMIASVPKATLIVTNPTHFSVALRYNPPEDFAPVVIAKGQDILALKIREIALENNIPIMENVPLARALYKQVEVNQVIPEEFYHAVARLIRYINQH